MLSAVFDTHVVRDYLLGVTHARRAFAKYPHRAISVVTWLEVMQAAPTAEREATRLFLCSCERLAINEAIADRAQALLLAHTRLGLPQALSWATAQVNGLVFVATRSGALQMTDAGLWLAY